MEIAELRAEFRAARRSLMRALQELERAGDESRNAEALYIAKRTAYMRALEKQEDQGDHKC